MNIICTENLHVSETEWPLVIPTCALNLSHMMVVRAKIEPKGKLSVFASWHALNRIKQVENMEELDRMQWIFDLIPDETTARHDWINGAWVKRIACTPEWACATTEDAVFLDPTDYRKGAVLRCRRVLNMMEPISGTPTPQT